MEIIVLFVMVTLIAQASQLICYAAHVRKSATYDDESSVTSGIAADLG